METEIQQLFSGSILADVFGDFVDPNVSLDVDDVAMEQDLMALFQAESLLYGDDLPTLSNEYIGTSVQDVLGPFSGLEELLRQSTPNSHGEYESSGYSSPTNSCVEASLGDLTVDLLPDLDSVDCYFSDDFSWDSVQDEPSLKEKAFHVYPNKIAPKLKVIHPPSPSPPPAVIKSIKIKREPPKKDRLRGVRKKACTKEKVKKEQNKMAALRYRNKKKEEEVCMLSEYEELLQHNENLRRVVLDKEQEVKVLRQLLMDVIAK